MLESEAVALMKTSDTVAEWHANEVIVKAKWKDYDSQWYEVLVESLVMWETLTKNHSHQFGSRCLRALATINQ